MSKFYISLTMMTVALLPLAAKSEAIVTCPLPPSWISVYESEVQCSYQIVKKEQFDSDQMLGLLTLLSRNGDGRIKRFQLPEGRFEFLQPIRLNGANGWNLHLIGAGSSRTKLIFHNSHGVNLEGPFAFGLIDKLTINGNERNGMQNDAIFDKAGILARRGAVIRLGRDVVVEEFSRVGIQAVMSSTIYAANVVSRNNGSDGFVAAYNSTIYARESVSYGNRGDGYFSEAASSIDAAGSTAKLNIIDRSKGKDRGGDGYVAIMGSVINADNTTVEDNEDQDFVVLGQSVIYARETSARVKIKTQIRDNSTFLTR